MMHLNVTLPFRVEVDQPVRKVCAEGGAGGFGLLPNHADFLSTIEPGLLWFVDEHDREIFLAVGRGLLVKAGPEVRVATIRAVRSERLEDVRQAVDEYILKSSEHEQQARQALERMRADIVRRFAQVELHE